MLGNLGYYSGKGMVLVPDLSGLYSSAAQAAIAAAGLTVGSISSTSSGATSGNNGQVASSTPSSGTLVDYETSVSFVTYSYSPPQVDPPVWTDSAISNSFTQGSAYTDSVSATNGAAYTWEYVNSGNGADPNAYWVQGITIQNSNGVISGTPTTAGQIYSFRIVAYNSGGTIYSQTYAGTVASSSGGGGGGGGSNPITLSVSITSKTTTSVSGTATAQNTTGAYGSISLSSSAGSISPSSFVYSGEAYPGTTTTSTSFTVTGLSPSQSVTVTASGGGAAPATATTTTNDQPASCTPVLTDSYDTFIGATSTKCNYQTTNVYTNPCTQEVTYVNTTYQIDRDCPTCTCLAV